jgi:hypothetical protein
LTREKNPNLPASHPGQEFRKRLLCRCIMGKPRRGNRHHRDAFLIYNERILVGTMGGAPVFDDTQTPSGELVGDAVVELDYAVGYVFL